MHPFLRKRKSSFSYAFSGLGYLIRTQPNSWIHFAITLLVILAGIVLRISLLEWALILFAIGLVLVSELFNTAVEALIDLVSPENHPLAKAAKDVAAGAVLVSAITAAGIGLLVFLPAASEYFTIPAG